MSSALAASRAVAAARKASMSPYPPSFHFDYQQLADSKTLNTAIEALRDKVMTSLVEQISGRLNNTAPFPLPPDTPLFNQENAPGTLAVLLSRTGGVPTATELTRGKGLPIVFSAEMQKFLVDQGAHSQTHTTAGSSSASVAVPVAGVDAQNPPPASPTTASLPIHDGAEYDPAEDEELRREFEMAMDASDEPAVAQTPISKPLTDPVSPISHAVACEAIAADLSKGTTHPISIAPPSPCMDTLGDEEEFDVPKQVTPAAVVVKPLSSGLDDLDDEEEEELEAGSLAPRPVEALLNDTEDSSYDKEATDALKNDPMFMDDDEDDDKEDDEEEASSGEHSHDDLLEERKSSEEARHTGTIHEVAPMSPTSMAAPRPTRRAAAEAMLVINPKNSGLEDPSDELGLGSDDGSLDSVLKPTKSKTAGSGAAAATSLRGILDDESEDSSFDPSAVDEPSSESSAVIDGIDPYSESGDYEDDDDDDEDEDEGDNDDDDSSLVIVAPSKKTPPAPMPVGSKRPAPEAEESRKKVIVAPASAASRTPLLEPVIKPAVAPTPVAKIPFDKSAPRKRAASPIHAAAAVSIEEDSASNSRKRAVEDAKEPAKRGGGRQQLVNAGEIHFKGPNAELEEATFNLIHYLLAEKQYRGEPWPAVDGIQPSQSILDISSQLTGALLAPGAAPDRQLTPEQRRAVELHNRHYLSENSGPRRTAKKAVSELSFGATPTKGQTDFLWICQMLVSYKEQATLAIKKLAGEARRICEITGAEEECQKLFVYTTGITRSFIVGPAVVNVLERLQVVVRTEDWFDANFKPILSSLDTNHKAGGWARLAAHQTSRRVNYTKELASGNFFKGVMSS